MQALAWDVGLLHGGVCCVVGSWWCPGLSGWCSSGSRLLYGPYQLHTPCSQQQELWVVVGGELGVQAVQGKPHCVTLQQCILRIACILGF